MVLDSGVYNVFNGTLNLTQLQLQSACIFKAVKSRFDISQVCTARVILELVFVQSGHFRCSDTDSSRSELEAVIQFLCTF